MKMLISERFAHTARTGGVLALVGVLAWGCVMAAPSAVFADDPAGLKAELEAASSKLDAMYEKAAAVGEELNGTKIALGSTERDIEQAKLDIESKQAELAAAQDDLSGRVVDDYKGGGVSLLSMFLGSSSLDEMMARITYANKVAEAAPSRVSAASSAIWCGDGPISRRSAMSRGSFSNSRRSDPMSCSSRYRAPSPTWSPWAIRCARRSRPSARRRP